MKKLKYLFAVIMMFSLILNCSIFANASSAIISDRELVAAIEEAAGNTDECVRDVYADKNGNIRFDISVPTLTKESIIMFINDRDYEETLDIYIDLSKAGKLVLDAYGRSDKLFIVNFLDDANDKSSDLIYSIVNGNVVYDCRE